VRLEPQIMILVEADLNPALYFAVNQGFSSIRLSLKILYDA